MFSRVLTTLPPKYPKVSAACTAPKSYEGGPHQTLSIASSASSSSSSSSDFSHFTLAILPGRLATTKQCERRKLRSKAFRFCPLKLSSSFASFAPCVRFEPPCHSSAYFPPSTRKLL